MEKPRQVFLAGAFVSIDEQVSTVAYLPMSIHLARNYSELVEGPRHGSPSLPGYKVRQITQWMAEHMTEEFSLDQLAAQAGLSKFHFLRLFKRKFSL